MFIVKLILSNVVIICCVMIGKRFPTLGGLIATMPLTSMIVLIWLASDNPGDTELISNYSRGVLWGIIPTIAFFAIAFICLRRGTGISTALAAGGLFWLGGALIHQWLLR